MRLLLVEDELPLADSIRRGLIGEGFQVDHVADGIDALWRAREGAYDAIILDIMIPSMNGYEVCRTLRSDDVWTPILMLTAKDGEYDEADAFELGADDYLRKPFAQVVLVARLHNLMRRAAAPRSQVMAVGDLVLNPSTRTCHLDTEAIELTPREFSVLETLIRRHPNIVTKPDLLDSVWGMDFEGDPNIVEVYIGYLRRKIDKRFDRTVVKTVRGVGYRLVDSSALERATGPHRDTEPHGDGLP